MSLFSIWLKALRHCARTIWRVLFDLVALLPVVTKSRTALVAENLFLRKQLAMFQERKVRPHRAEDSARWLMAHLSRLFDWRGALVVVKPDTLSRWHRKGFRLFWRWKSKPVGRPAVPKSLQELIRKMAAENPTWGEEHIANDLKLKLGIRVSPRTVGKYTAQGPADSPIPAIAGLPSCAITPRLSWRATFSWWSRPDSVSCMYSSSWNWAGVRSYITT